MKRCVGGAYVLSLEKDNMSKIYFLYSLWIFTGMMNCNNENNFFRLRKFCRK